MHIDRNYDGIGKENYLLKKSLERYLLELVNGIHTAQSPVIYLKATFPWLPFFEKKV